MFPSSFESVYKETFPFWNEISEKEKDYICQNSSAITYPKGTSVHDSSECSGVIFVRSAALGYISCPTREKILPFTVYTKAICACFPLPAYCKRSPLMCLSLPKTTVNAMLSTVLLFPKSAMNNPKIKIFSLETAVSRFSDVMWVMQQILFMSMDKRLAVFLIDESARLKSEVITLTHEQIAKYMGSAREVVSRMLKYFANEGIIESSRKAVKILDKKRLHDLAVQHF